MDAKLSHDLVGIEAVLQRTLEHALDVLDHIDERPAALAPKPVEPQPLPSSGPGFDAALDDFLTRWAPGFSGSAGARYLGFVTGGATPAALAGDWLTSVYDQNPTAGIPAA